MLQIGKIGVQMIGYNVHVDELLPRLQGSAGEFVYGQLTHDTRSNYRTLCKELTNRFRVVETSKTFWVQFSHRNQKCGESVEEYAAELKKLYDKAHVRRDTDTRREDLLRRFLDGLIDDKARFHVEFIKEPKDIDEAVFQTVCFQETKHKLRTHDRVRLTYDSDSNDDIDVARIVPGKNKSKEIKNEVTPHQISPLTNSEIKDLEKLREIVRAELNAMSSNQSNSTAPQNRTPQGRHCFYCHDPSHIKRNCPKLQNAQGQGQGQNKGHYQSQGRNQPQGHNQYQNPSQYGNQGQYQNQSQYQNQGQVIISPMTKLCYIIIINLHYNFIAKIKALHRKLLNLKAKIKI
jgi:hypothetical protein